jgi:transcriptional regulator with XRE-family HTH domain
MQTVDKIEYYDSGFRKDMARGKYDLPINHRLKLARYAKGLTSEKASAELKRRGIKLGQSSIQGYEANEKSTNHRYPSIPAFLALADLYECSLDYIFGIHGELNRNPEQDLKDRIKYEYNLKWGGKEINVAKRKKIMVFMEALMADPLPKKD